VGVTFHDSWMKIARRVSGGVLLRRDIGEEDSAQCLALMPFQDPGVYWVGWLLYLRVIADPILMSGDCS